MGTLTNGKTTIDFENPAAPGLDWRKSSRTDLHPIVKDCVLVAEAPDAVGHPHDRIPDGTRMIAMSDSKNEQGAVLSFSRVEFTKFVVGVKSGEFDDLLATEGEMQDASKASVAA